MTSFEASPSSQRGELASTTLSSIVLLLALLPIFGSSFLRGETFQMRDHFDYFTPLRHYTAERLGAGDLPMWNPFSGSGEAWLANPQTGVFYPPAWIFLVLPFAAAYQLFLAFHLFILGFSMDRWLRRRVSGGAALFGALALMLSGATLSMLDVQNNLTTFAWFPLMLLHAERVRERGSLRDHALLAFSMTLTFLGAEPMLTLFGGAFALLIAFGTKRTVAWRPMFTCVLTILLSAAQLVPFLELFLRSDRRFGLDAGEAFLHSMRPLDWLGLFVSSAAPPGRYEVLQISQQYLTSIYGGGVVMALALLGAWSYGRLSADLRTTVRRLSFAAGAALVLTLGSSFGLSMVFSALQLDVSRYPARFFPFVAFFIVTLAAAGFDLVTRTSKRTLLSVAATTVALSAIGAWVLAGGELQAWRLQISIMAAAAAGIILLNWKLFTRRRRFYLLLLAVLAIDLAISARQNLVAAPPTLEVARYESRIGSHSKLDRLMPATGARYDRVQWFAGYLPLLNRTHDADSPSPLTTEVYARLRRETDVAFGVAGVDHLLVPPGVEVPGFHLEMAGASANLLQKDQAQQSFLRLSSVWKIAATDSDALREVRRAKIPVVAGTEQAPVGVSRVARVRIGPQEGDQRQFTVTTDVPSLLWLTQNDAPQWKVMIDGEESEKIRVFGALRGVIVPAGVHEVEWRHSSSHVVVSIFLSIVGVIIFFYAVTRGS